MENKNLLFGGEEFNGKDGKLTRIRWRSPMHTQRADDHMMSRQWKISMLCVCAYCILRCS